MTAVYTNTFKSALAVDNTLMDNAQVQMVMFDIAATLMPGEPVEGVPVASSPYAAIDTIAGLEAQLGWGPSIPSTVTATLPGVADEEDDTYFAHTDGVGFVLPGGFPNSIVKVIAFVYKGPKTMVGGGYVTLPGTAGNYLSMTLGQSPVVSPDICVVAKIAAVDWTPATAGVIAAKNNPVNGQRSWLFQLGTSGALTFTWSADGTAVGTANSAALGFANGSTQWVAVTFDHDGGPGAVAQTRFWKSTDGSAWTNVSDVNAGATVAGLFNNTSVPLTIGAHNGGANEPFAGTIHRLSIRSGVGASNTVGGTEVLLFDAPSDLHGISPALIPTLGGFSISSGQTLFINRSGTPSTTFSPTTTVTDKVMFLTDTPVLPPVLMRAGDGIIPLADTSGDRVFVSWSFGSPIEGPLVRLMASPPFEAARTQHVWIYPQRVNMIANPSFEEDVDYWRSSGTPSQITTTFPTQVKVATTANLPALSGLLTVDTVVTAAADRVLVKNQTAAQDNGIYVVAAGAWLRSADADNGTDLKDLMVYVKGGSQRGTGWICRATDDPIVVGTSLLPFELTIASGRRQLRRALHR